MAKPTIQELMGDPKAELHPSLKHFIQDGPMGKMIHHPLIVEMFLAPEMHDMINKRFEYKKKAIKTAKEEKKWERVIWHHERPYRIEAFLCLDEEFDISDKDFWSIMSEIMIDTENRWQHASIISELLDSRRGRRSLMDEDDRKVFDELPDEVTVYRGCQEVLETWPHHNREGMSWTLSKEKAEWFAKRFKREHSLVLTGVCQKEDIIAVLLGRGEEEVLIDPVDVEVTDERKI